MANNIGTLITSIIKTFSNLDTFPVADSNDLLGGFKVVQDINSRDNIPLERRVEGSLCYIISEQKLYQLKNGINNTNWALIDSYGTSSQLKLGNGNLINIGDNNGIASLDSGGKIPVSQLPNSIMEYKGNYNALTNTPLLVDGIGNTGDTYRVNIAGPGVNNLNYIVSDYVVYNGSSWEKSHAGSDNVLSVNGKAGIVVLDKVDIGLSNVPNIDTTTAINNTHTHSNKSILDSITEAFTTSLKTAYDNAVSWITTNGTNILNHLTNTNNPHNVTKEQVGLSNVPNIDYGYKFNPPLGTQTQYIAGDGTVKDFNFTNFTNIGILNASTAVATISSGNVTLTATPPIGWLDGQSVTVTTIGDITFSGINFTSGTTLQVGDELRKRGTQWELLKINFSAIYPELINRIYSNTGSTNELNLTTSLQGYYLSGTGTLLTTASNLAVSDFINWDSNTQFKVALNGGISAQIFNITQYDSLKNFISGSYAGADITPPSKYSGAIYFRITYRPNLVNQLNFGNTVLPYEIWYPKKVGNKDTLSNNAVYKPDIRDVDLLALLALKANTGGSIKTLAQIDSEKSSLTQGVIYDTTITPGSSNFKNPANVLDSKSLGSAGEILDVPNTYATLDFTDWGTNTQFVAGLNGTANRIFAVAQYNSNKVYITGSYQGPDNINGTINKYSGAFYFRVTFRKLENNQFNWGSIVLPYENYYPAITKKIGNKDANGLDATFKPDTTDSILLALLALKANTGGSIKTLAQIDSEKSSLAQGVIYESSKSNNIFDETVKSSGYINTSGSVTPPDTPNTYYVTPMIAWEVNTVLSVGFNGTIPTNGSFSAAQYDYAGTFISGSHTGYSANIKTLNKYSGATYFRITMRIGQQNQLNFGNTVLPYDVFFLKKVANKDALNNSVTFKPDTTDSDLLALMLTKSYINNALLTLQEVWSSYNVITVKKDGTGNFTNIMQAVASITDASPTKRYEIQIYDDHYAYQKSDFTLVPSTSIYYAFAHAKDYVKLRGIGEMKIIYAELPSIGMTATDYSNYETMHYDGSGEIENIRVIAKNIRYPIHYEQGNSTINQNASFKSKNFEVEHLGAEEVDISVRWMQCDAWGEGATSGVKHEIKFAKFIGARHGFRTHSNTLSTFPNLYSFQNCLFASKLQNGNALFLDNLSFTEKRFFDFNGCTISGTMYVSSNVTSLPPAIIKKILPSAKITGAGNTPMYYNNQQVIGTVLRVKSNTTGIGSFVKVVQDDAGLFGRKIQIVGSLGLKGSIYGDEELIDYGTDMRNIIGHRLGDCRTVNKLLVLNIDGTNRTVTFSDYYSDSNYATNPLISNATILASINTQLSGFAIADYFAINAEYYPEFSDVLFYRGNTSTTNYIPKGSFVKFLDTNKCRIATIGEIPDGFAIDDIPVYSTVMQLGRIVKNCIVTNIGRFSPTISGTFAEGDRFKLTSSGILIVDNTLQDSFAVAISSDKILIK